MDANRWDITNEQYTTGQEKRCLESQELKNGVFDTYLNLKNSIIESEGIEEYHEEPEDKSDDPLKGCFYGIPKVYKYVIYETQFIFPGDEWNAIEWAATYRARDGWGSCLRPQQINRNGIKFKDHMRSEVQGLLGELFVCAVFDKRGEKLGNPVCNFDKFWYDFCKAAGKGDGHFDFEVESYRIDVKTTATDNIQIGTIENNQPKDKELIIALVTSDWVSEKIISLKFDIFIDSQPFWDIRADYPVKNLSAVEGFNSTFFVERRKVVGLDINPRYPKLLELCPVRPYGAKEFSDEQLDKLRDYYQNKYYDGNGTLKVSQF